VPIKTGGHLVLDLVTAGAVSGGHAATPSLR
jgi:hypothetical protein